MNLIPQKLDYLAVVLAIASFVAVKMLYPDVFRGSKFWVNAGYLAAILGILTVGGILYSQIKESQLGLLSVLSAGLVLYGFWLIKDATNPDTRFKVLKEAYTKQFTSTDIYGVSGYVSWDIKLDFFESPVADRLRADKPLIDSLAKSLKITERWRDLGRGLYYNDYIDQTLICYTSLIEQGYSEKYIMESTYGSNIMGGILFYELNKDRYYGNLPPKMQKLLEDLPSNPKGVFHKLSIGQIDHMKEMNIYELEMFLYFLTQYPHQIPEEKLNTLFVIWKEKKPAYKKDIEQLLSAREELKKWIRLSGDENQQILGVNFGDKLKPKTQEMYLEKIKPFLHLLGYEFTVGNDISFVINQNSEHLIERSQSNYETVQKTRQVNERYKMGNTYINRPRTERYTESVYTGSTKTDVYKRQLTLSFLEGTEQKELFSLTEYLPHQYFNKEKRDYEIDYTEMARRECWVLALPQSWYCPGCDDY